MSQTKKNQTAVIIPAGGIGRRMGLDRPKQFADLGGAVVLRRTVAVFMEMGDIARVVVVLPSSWLAAGRESLAGFDSRICFATGGETRQDSVAAGLAEIPAEVEVVVVHDAARPLVSPAIIRACVVAARRDGAAMVAVPVKDTLKRVSGVRVEKTVDREGLWRAQTPQAARFDLFTRAFARAERDGFVATDEAAVFEHDGIGVTVVNGSETNLKITRPDDMAIARSLVSPGGGMRIGHGYDAHRLKKGLALVLGGEKIAWDMGLVGHSDADVLTHAVCDAILGAVGGGDIGHHFPDNDPAYKGISSLRLLADVARLAAVKGFAVVNLDVTVIAQAPKLMDHMAAMRTNLARVLAVAEDRVNIKATTTETMGFCGRGEGIAAHAVVLLGLHLK